MRKKFDVLNVEGTSDYDSYLKSGDIIELGHDFDEKYLEAVKATSVNPNLVSEIADDLRVVYTPLHGAGYKLVPEIFSLVGLKHLYTVDSQMIPDGNFPTVNKPNPEYKDVFTEGIEIANKINSDLIIATDPDADRVGVMTRDKSGEFITLTGNQMGSLLLDYVIGQRRALGTLPESAYCVKSIVSTDMAYKIAEVNGIKLHDVLTGFKFIGEVIKKYEADGIKDSFVLGFEESYGYLLGSYARDKDAVEASMIILEMTAFYKKQGMTLADALEKLYLKYGFYSEKMIDVYMEGLDGIENRRKVMERLRSAPPAEIGSFAVASVGDYITGKITELKTGNERPTGQPSSDVIYYTLVNGDKIIVRPSGTEPKIKIYILSHGEDLPQIAKKNAEYEIASRKLTDI